MNKNFLRNLFKKSCNSCFENKKKVYYFMEIKTYDIKTAVVVNFDTR